VKGLVPRVVLYYLKVYYDIQFKNDRFVNDTQCPLSLSLGADPGLDAVLERLCPEVSRLVGLELAPTYSFTRRYVKDDVLARHQDRPACEISVTVSIQIPKRARASTLYMKSPNRDEVKVEMNEGDGCVYAGMEVEHWRNDFASTDIFSFFLHFIARQNPGYAQLVFDGRRCLGANYPKQV
jgi:hypothetical protein